MQTTQRGNVLFLILIAVVLFAALSYAITSSSRTGSTDISKEKADLTQGVTDSCTSNINMGLMRVKQINGCSADEISYELANGGNANPNAPANKSCHLFHPNGGGIAPCGAHTEIAETPTGIITVGNTTTSVTMAAGYHLKCHSWSGEICNLAFSGDGTTFLPGSEVCISDHTGDSLIDIDDAPDYVDSMASEFCAAACGDPQAVNTVEVTGFSSGSKFFDVSPPYLRNFGDPYNIRCTYKITGTGCSCF